MIMIIVLVVLAAAFIALVIWGPKASEVHVPEADVDPDTALPEICVPDQPEPPEIPEDWVPAPDPGPIGESDNLDDLLDADGNIK